MSVQGSDSQNCRSLAQTTFLLYCHTHSGMKCPRERFLGRPTRWCLLKYQGHGVSLTFGICHVDQRGRACGEGPCGVEDQNPSPTPIGAGQCHGKGRGGCGDGGEQRKPGGWGTADRAGGWWEGLGPCYEIRASSLPLTFDFDLMKGNPTLHLRKSDSSSSQEMPISS